MSSHLSNAEAQKRLKMLERRAKERAVDDLHAVMSTPIGRRFIWRILVQSGVWDASFNGGSEHVTSYREGRRSVGLALMAKAQEECPSEYVHMVSEQLASTREDTLHRKAAEAAPNGEDE